MKKLFLITVLFSLFNSLCGQHKGNFVILDGKILEGQFFIDNLYIYDQFKEGRMVSKSGLTYQGKINISTLNQNLRFLTQAGDTISVEEERDVNIVSIGPDFYRKINNQYIQVLDSYGEVYVGLVRKMNIGAENLPTAYGGSSITQAVSKMTSYQAEFKYEHIKGSASFEYFYNETLFLVNRGKMQIVSRRAFEKAFPKQKRVIEEYLSLNNVEFKEREEVMALFKHIVSNQQ